MKIQNIKIIILIFTLSCSMSNICVANDFSIFHIKNLSTGKGVTVGKHVLAYLNTNEKIEILGMNPPQSLFIKLDSNSKNTKNNLTIDGQWIHSLQQLDVFVSKKISNTLKKNKEHNIVFIKKPPDVISMPLKLDKPIKLNPIIKGLARNARYKIYSDRPFKIKRE